MGLYKRKKTSEIKRQLYVARKHLSSLDDKVSELEKKKKEVLETIQSLKNEINEAIELDEEEKEIFVSNKVPVVEELAGQVGQPLKSVQIVGKTISFVYDAGGREIFYSYDDIDEGTKEEIARLKKSLREIGAAEASVV